jgi:hypothetical protein
VIVCVNSHVEVVVCGFHIVSWFGMDGGSSGMAWSVPGSSESSDGDDEASDASSSSSLLLW